MKIAIVTHNITKNDGQGRATYELVKYLSNKGHILHLYINKIDKTLLNVKDIIIHYIPTFFDRPVLLKCLAFYIIATIRLLWKKYDIIHLNGAVCYAWYHVNTCHFCHTAWRRMGFEKDLYHRFYTLISLYLEKWSYRYKRGRIIAISDSVKRELNSLVGVVSQRINVIYYGVDCEEFSPIKHVSERESLLKTFNLNKTEFLLLFVGDLGKRKGLDWLLQAMINLDSNVNLLIAGRKKKFYIRKVKEYNIEQRVKFLGFRQDINEIYKCVDLFVFPTCYDPFGMVVLEAMASGLPVITSKFAGSSELITNGKDGIILEDPTNPDEIQAKIEFLIQNKEARMKIANQARKTALKYSWKRMAENTERVYCYV